MMPLVITTFNAEWFFDHETPNPIAPEKIQNMYAKAAAISDLLANTSPDILCLQEIQGEKVLKALCKAFAERHGLTYNPHWPGVASARTGQSVGLLVKETIQVMEIGNCKFTAEERAGAGIDDSDASEYLSKHIWLKFAYGQKTFVLVNLHMKAQTSADTPAVRQKESLLLHHMLHSLRRGDANRHVVVAGDFNEVDPDVMSARAASAPTSDAIARIKTPNTHCWQSYDCALVNVLDRVPRHRRFSVAWTPEGADKEQQVSMLDYIMVDSELAGLIKKVMVGNDAWQWHEDRQALVPRKDPISDHFPVSVVLHV